MWLYYEFQGTQIRIMRRNLHPLLLYGRRLFIDAVFPAGLGLTYVVVSVRFDK